MGIEVMWMTNKNESTSSRDIFLSPCPLCLCISNKCITLIRVLLIVGMLTPSLLKGVDIVESSFSIGYTYRQDSLNWSIAAPDGTPNVLSELKWEDLMINQAKASFHAVTGQNIYLKASADYGRIFNGKNRDSDYFEDDRTDEFSRSINNAGKGEVFDLSTAVGYRFSLFCERLSLVPLIGAAWSEQHLRMYDGDQVIPDLGPITGLHNSYKTRWYSAWSGVDLSYKICNKLITFASFEYHWAWYRGRGHWNLRDDFLTDFKQTSFGYGLVGELGVNYILSGNWGVTITVGYQDWKASGGDHSLTVDIPGFGSEKLETRFNGVNWHTFNSSILLSYIY